MNSPAREKNHNVRNRSIPRYSPEDISKFKINERVLCCGVEATIRDIYTRTFRYEDENGIEKHGCFLSYRLLESEWQALDIRHELLEKLNGEVLTTSRLMPKNIRIPDL